MLLTGLREWQCGCGTETPTVLRTWSGRTSSLLLEVGLYCWLFPQRQHDGLGTCFLRGRQFPLHCFQSALHREAGRWAQHGPVKVGMHPLWNSYNIGTNVARSVQTTIRAESAERGGATWSGRLRRTTHRPDYYVSHIQPCNLITFPRHEVAPSQRGSCVARSVQTTIRAESAFLPL